VLALAVACGGGGEEAPPDTSAGAPPSSNLEITAHNLRFDKGTLVAVPGVRTTLSFHNQDRSVLHNIGIYRDSSTRESIFVGETFTGDKTVVYTFDAPAAGAYFFRCDVHPEMKGDFAVRSPH
jgi:plastocyanin